MNVNLAFLDIFDGLLKAQGRTKSLARNFLFAITGREVL